MAVHGWSKLIWALVGLSAVFWAFKLLASPGTEPAPTSVVAEPVLRGDLTRFLGTEWPRVDAPVEAAAPNTDTRLTLVGVISPRNGAAVGTGMALISVDGNPPVAYAIGDIVDGKQLLQGVSQRMARLGPSGGETTLTLTIALPFAASGTTP